MRNHIWLMRLPGFFPTLGKDTPSPEVRPSANVLPPIEKETNTMTQGDLDRLIESNSFSPNLQIRLLETNDDRL